MIGDIADMLARLKMVLPARWFADGRPFWMRCWVVWRRPGRDLRAAEPVQAQTRLATASGIFLDIAAQDYLGRALPRRAGEADAAFSARLRANLLAPRATRAGLVEALNNLTGRAPVVFEPLNAADTGGYNVNIGYYGGWRVWQRGYAVSVPADGVPAQ